MLKLPIHEYSISLQILRSSISFITISSFQHKSPFSSSFGFIPTYFLYKVIIRGRFIILLSMYSLLVYRNTQYTFVCLSILQPYSAHELVLEGFLFVNLWNFLNKLSCSVQIECYFPIYMLFITFSCLSAMTRTLTTKLNKSTMLSKSDESTRWG